jgi:hypothetical protein
MLPARPAAARRVFWFLPSRRVALGVSAHAAPSLVFVLTGVALGPQVLNVLSAGALAQLDPVISVTLAVLGVFIGSGYASAGIGQRILWLGGATAQALVTLVSVGWAMFVLLNRWQPPLPLDPFMMAAVLGLCCAASAAVGTEERDPPAAAVASHLADFDDIPLVVLGTILVPVVAGAASPLTVIGIAIAAGLIVGTAGAILFTRAQSGPERGVFVAGTVVLLGGAAAYTSASPLTTGCIAGLVWAVAQESPSSLVESDLRRLQHPLVALLLIVAGASVQFTLPLLWLAAPLVLFRLAGKLLGSLTVARALGLRPAMVGALLAPPGVFGIALALNVQQVLNTGDTILVSTITAATVAAELLAATLLPGEDEA